MKDAKGHGSDPRGAHSEGVQQVGRPSTMFRGTEKGTTPQSALRMAPTGDLGRGVYLSPNEKIAGSYGGGPKASLSDGSRVVHSYEFNRTLEPQEIAHVFGGAKIGSDVQIVRGDGHKIYDGPWSGKLMESALSPHSNIKAVFGDEKSIGINQIAIRDPSVLKAK
jgi:hypothetical protein